MLTTLASVRLIPELSQSALLSDAYVNQLIADADAAIKTWTKRRLELAAYTEFYSGDNSQCVVLRQFPVLVGSTTVTAASDGQALPQSTISVASTSGFDSAVAGPAWVAVQTGPSSYASVQYTGVTATSFTGCTGGTGTLSSAANQNQVSAPVVYQDPNGYWGQGPSSFTDATLCGSGRTFAAVVDSGGAASNRGLLQRLGVGGGLPINWGPVPGPYGMGGKLGGTQLARWGYGQGNIKVRYSAGYATVPADLQGACNTLVAYLIRTMPTGSPLSSESLGAYSYSVMQYSADVPEIGSLLQTLKPYREYSLGM